MQFLMQRQSVFKWQKVVRNKIVLVKVLKIVVLRDKKWREVVK
jgi:hypothetical protein